LANLDPAGDNGRMVSVRLTEEALEQLASLPRTIRERVGKLFERLTRWPEVSRVKALSGDLVGWYRLRTDD
jgi:mRNA-degrading endonuclease RelE of RelBE toxin-antitoxin system